MSLYVNNPVSAASGSASGETYFSTLFQSKTGLSPMSISSYFNDFTEGALTAGSLGWQVSVGTATISTTLGGGVVVSVAPAGVGYADWTPGAASQANQIVNLRTKKWMVGYRLAVASAPAAASRVSCGVYNGTTPTYVGIGYNAADTFWQYLRGATIGATVKTATTQTLDSTGNVYLWMYLYNDATSIYYNTDVLAGNADVAAEASSNLPSGVGMPYLYNEGNGSGDTLRVDAAFCYAER